MRFNILCVGNSLLHHGPSAEVMWNGNWGMAASCEENDYFHVLQRAFSEKYPDIDVSWYKCGSISIEKAIKRDETFDYTEILDGIFGEFKGDKAPEIVSLQLGDNTPHHETSDTAYANALIQTVNYLRKINPDVKVILCLPWYGEMIDSKHIGTLIASRETQMPYVDLTQFFCKENQALGLFEHNGVQNHPGDRGMRKIAEAYLEAISKIVDSKNQI